MSEKTFDFSPEDLMLIQGYIESYPIQVLHIPGLRAALTSLHISKPKPTTSKRSTRPDRRI